MLLGRAASREIYKHTCKDGCTLKGGGLEVLTPPPQKHSVPPPFRARCKIFRDPFYPHRARAFFNANLRRTTFLATALQTNSAQPPSTSALQTISAPETPYSFQTPSALQSSSSLQTLESFNPSDAQMSVNHRPKMQSKM